MTRKFLSAVAMVVVAATLSACVLAPAPVEVRRPGCAWVPGHRGPWGGWHPGHCA